MGKNLFYVGAGGFAGTISRYGLDAVIPYPESGLPMGILLVNLLGCLFLAWFLTGGAGLLKLSAEARLLVGTGFTGSFTTMSTFTVGTLKLIHSGQTSTAVLYVLLSVAGGLLMSCVGVWLGRRRASKQEGETL